MENENNFLQNENEIKLPLKVVYILDVGKIQKKHGLKDVKINLLVL